VEGTLNQPMIETVDKKQSRLVNKENAFHLVKEVIWLIITAMVCCAILYPVTQKIDFLYYRINFAFIFITLTYFRWTLTLSSLPFFRPALVRFLVFAVNLSLFIFLMQQEQKLMIFIDDFYTEDFGFPKVILYDHVKESLFKYLYGELVLFGTGSLIMIGIFNLRLLFSWWQFYKYKANSLLDD
jgi:hypothetical protein